MCMCMCMCMCRCMCRCRCGCMCRCMCMCMCRCMCRCMCMCMCGCRYSGSVVLQRELGQRQSRQGQRQRRHSRFPPSSHTHKYSSAQGRQRAVRAAGQRAQQGTGDAPLVPSLFSMRHRGAAGGGWGDEVAVGGLSSGGLLNLQ
jgi:hypothetical protein